MNTSKQQHLFEPEPTAWELAAGKDQLTACVVFNRPVETVFHYLLPDSLRDIAQPGQRVKAPFGRGNRLVVGYCVGLEPPPETTRPLKSIESVIDREPLLNAEMLQLTRWIAERYVCSWGQVLDSVIPAGVKKRAGTRLVNSFEPASGVCGKLSELQLPSKQKAVMETLCTAQTPMKVDELCALADCGTSPITALRNKGLIRAIRSRSATFQDDTTPVPREPDLELNTDQRVAVDNIVQCLREMKHRTYLLHGVTGSGKTEVYIQAIREVVSYGRQAIVLVPEISLTPQTIRRFRSRFDSVAVLHSHLSEPERHWHWQQISQGKIQVIVGARSAIFAPTPHLGLIVIDEEHETTFKQDTTPRYHAREVARERARMERIPLVLGSATPTLESFWRIECGKDILLSLPKRVAERPLPPVVVVDIRNDPYIARGSGIGRALFSSMKLALQDGGQVILFLNLRGYAPTVWCRSCGEGVKCPECDITLTLHKDRRIVLCHFCDFEAEPPTRCPYCNDPGIRYLGIGTQRLEQEVRSRFPDAACLRMDSDSMRKHGSHDIALESFRRGEVDILLGTQMIAKGLDFPNVTLVGVVDADTMLHQPDLRAAERTFQLLAQVAGRTGRSHRGGRVLVQSSSPEEPAIQFAAAHDYFGFIKQELVHRQETNAPPVRHLIRIILRGRHEEELQACARMAAEKLSERAKKVDASEVRILGPAPAPVSKLKGDYRYHLQVTCSELEEFRDIWQSAAIRETLSHGVECMVDVDAINMR